MTKYDLGLVLEQTLGHVTHTQNLQANLRADPEVRAHWNLIPFEAEGAIGRIPLYGSNWTVRAGMRARRKLSELCRNQHLDALFFHTQVPAILARNWMRKIPSIVSLDATPLQYDELGAFYAHAKGPAWIEAIKQRMNRDCFATARHIVTWSDWAKDGLVRDYEVPPERVTVIPPGVNVRDWRRPSPRQPEDRPVRILFVGGNLERKGGLILLEAWRTLRHRGIELHLVTKDNVAAEPGLFVYNNMTANSDELKALYHSCDVFALPTFGDCLPMVLSEAGAAEMAIVTTRIAAIPEIIVPGETGLTIPTGDVVALTEALRQLSNDAALRHALGQQAAAHVQSAYDAEKNASRLLNLIKREAQIARPLSNVAA